MNKLHKNHFWENSFFEINISNKKNIEHTVNRKKKYINK